MATHMIILFAPCGTGHYKTVKRMFQIVIYISYGDRDNLWRVPKVIFLVNDR